jgi:hypothetical protein
MLGELAREIGALVFVFGVLEAVIRKDAEGLG